MFTLTKGADLSILAYNSLWKYARVSLGNSSPCKLAES